MVMTLEQVLAAAAKVARQAFNARGEVAPMWCGHRADGELVIITPESFATTAHKEAAAREVRRVFKEQGVVMFGYMTEAWMLESPAVPMSVFSRAIERGGSLEHHPDRREIIAIQAEDKTRCLLGHYFILRPEHGKPSLSPFIKTGSGELADSSGRMTRLLVD